MPNKNASTPAAEFITPWWQRDLLAALKPAKAPAAHRARRRSTPDATRPTVPASYAERVLARHAEFQATTLREGLSCTWYEGSPAIGLFFERIASRLAYTRDATPASAEGRRLTDPDKVVKGGRRQSDAAQKPRSQFQREALEVARALERGTYDPFTRTR